MNRRLADSTLRNMTKAELIERLRIAEHNEEAIYELYNRQIKTVENWEPVRHGHLINPNPYGECSICGYLIDIRQEYNYCPICGAKMDEERKEDGETG